MSESEDVKLKFDPDALTVGDLEDFEDAAGVPLSEAFKTAGDGSTTFTASAKALKALVWVLLRTERPGFTLEEARNVRIAELQVVEIEPDPTVAAD